VLRRTGKDCSDEKKLVPLEIRPDHGAKSRAARLRAKAPASHPQRHQDVERGRAVAILDQGRRAGIGEADERGVG
jgi:hypothetical protein